MTPQHSHCEADEVSRSNLNKLALIIKQNPNKVKTIVWVYVFLLKTVLFTAKEIAASFKV